MITLYVLHAENYGNIFFKKMGLFLKKNSCSQMHFWRIMLSGRQYKIYKLRCAPQFVSWYLMKWAIFHKYKLIFSQPSRILSLRNAGENKKTPGRKIQAMMTKAVRRSFCGTQQAVFRWKDALKDLCGGILTMADSVLFSGIIPGSCQIFLAWR